MRRFYLFMLVLLFFPTYVYSYTNISSCPQTFSVPGEYRLNQSISTTGDCLTITSSNVTIDCQGFTIDGDDGSSDDGI